MDPREGVSPVEIDLPYMVSDPDRRGNPRLYVRRFGRKIRIHETPGTKAFATAYAAAVQKLSARTPTVEPRKPAGPLPRTLGWLVMLYLADREVQKLASYQTRKGVLEECLDEPLEPDSPDLMKDCPIKALAPVHVKMLRDRKNNAGLPGAANNRRKYLSAVFGWAIEQDPPLMQTNPCRDAKKVEYATDGFHTWEASEVRQYLQRHGSGTKARLALAILLFLGVRLGDAVKLGPQHRRDGWMRMVPRKTRHRRLEVSEKPVLPALADVIDESDVGHLTYLVTEYGKPFSAKGFGNRFGKWCREAGLPHCTAHGLRKAGATILAENGATVPQLMAIYDWRTPGQAEVYIRKANRKKLAGDAMPLLTVGPLDQSKNSKSVSPANPDCLTQEKSTA